MKISNNKIFTSPIHHTPHPPSLTPHPAPPPESSAVVAGEIIKLQLTDKQPNKQQAYDVDVYHHHHIVFKCDD